jgi:hypothetical protein
MQHNGLDDAKNISRVIIQLALDGCDININSKIKNPITKIAKKTSNQENSETDSNESDAVTENEEEINSKKKLNE